MNDLRRSRRQWMWSTICLQVVFLTLALIPFTPESTQTLVTRFLLVLYFAVLVATVITCEKWMREKGRPLFPVVVFSFFGAVSFLIYHALWDQTKSVSARLKRGEDEGILRCSNCDEPYDLSEYRTDVDARCLKCKTVLRARE